MFDKLKFKAAVVGKGRTLGEVAEYLGINTVTLYRKVNGITEFNRKEIQDVCEYLELDSPMDIFFA